MAIGRPMPVVPSHSEPTPSTVAGVVAVSAVSDGEPGPDGAGAGVIVQLKPRELASITLPAVSRPATQMSDADNAAIAVSEDSCGNVVAVQLCPSKCMTTAPWLLA